LHFRSRISVRVRILSTPREPDLDGLKLDGFVPGIVRDVSPTIASWLIAQGYAVLEMRLLPDRRTALEPRQRPGRRARDS
jgi:hypothetical protein